MSKDIDELLKMLGAGTLLGLVVHFPSRRAEKRIDGLVPPRNSN